MDTTIRRLHAGDASELGLLEARARESVSGQRGGPAHLAETPAVGDWSTLVERDDRAVFVATIDGVPVGYLELLLDGRTARVRQVYVEPEARELGFGDDMLAEAIHTARTSGCAVFEGTALPGDRETKNLYERAGITARKLILSTEL